MPSGTLTPMAKKRGPIPKPDERREAVISIRCTHEYKAWVSENAKRRRTTPSQLVDEALVMLAEKYGFESPPER